MTYSIFELQEHLNTLAPKFTVMTTSDPKVMKLQVTFFGSTADAYLDLRTLPPVNIVKDSLEEIALFLLDKSIEREGKRLEKEMQESKN
jgi:hypothetical protein